MAWNNDTEVVKIVEVEMEMECQCITKEMHKGGGGLLKYEKLLNKKQFGQVKIKG